MITAFERTNKSNVIRPPHLYGFLPWDEENRYEALILEYVEGKNVVDIPTTCERISGD